MRFFKADYGDLALKRKHIGAPSTREGQRGALEIASEIVADKGYHSRDKVRELTDVGFRTYIVEPDRPPQGWIDQQAERDAVYANRRRIQGERHTARVVQVRVRAFQQLPAFPQQPSTGLQIDRVLGFMREMGPAILSSL